MSSNFNPIIENISVIVSKTELKDFNFKCLYRQWDGFVFFLSGKGIFVDKNGQKINIEQGSMLILEKGEKYQIYSEAPCSYITSGFNFSLETKKFLTSLPKVIPLNQKLQNKIIETCQVWKRHSWDSFARCKIFLLSLYVELYDLYVIKKDTFNSDVEKTKKYISENFGKEFSFKALFSNLATSPSSLRTKFKEETGETILNYREKCRIQNAVEMLESGNFTLTEIADELGYWDVYHFSKSFKKKKGLAPGKYYKLSKKP